MQSLRLEYTPISILRVQEGSLGVCFSYERILNHIHSSTYVGTLECKIRLSMKLMYIIIIIYSLNNSCEAHVP